MPVSTAILSPVPGIQAHVQIMVVVADDRDLFRQKTGRGAEAEHHAGFRLDAEAAVVTGDVIDIRGKTETFGGLADGAFIVAGGDAELEAALVQPGEEAGKIGHRH